MKLDTNTLNKAGKDPFFGAVLRHYGQNELEKAGFFDDGAANERDMAHNTSLQFLCTPLHKVRKRLSAFCDASKNYGQSEIAVLLTTGGFCPLHNGHIDMMESAKAVLESRGYYVAGGFIAPDHDQYVMTKCGKQAIHATERIRLAELAIKSSDWLSVDPWPAMYVDRTINYSDIIRHLEMYLRKHVTSPLPVRVFYVCGADNYSFAMAFVEDGGLVIVPRDETKINIEEKLLNNGRIFIAENHRLNKASSRMIRAGNTQHLPEVLLKDLESRQSLTNYQDISIYIRDEEDWNISSWKAKFGETVSAARDQFREDLINLIKNTFKSAFPDSIVKTERLSLSEQKKALKSFLDKKKKLPVISLDPCLEADYNLAISRKFTVSDSLRIEGLFSRPGHPEISEQVAAIPDGEYYLVDDDIATGQTIRDICQKLPETVIIKDIISLNHLLCGHDLNTIEAPDHMHLSDVVDLRDFLVGSRDSGLVVLLPDGAATRAPYLLPYVRNSSRMSLPADYEMQFSVSVWELNLKFFSSIKKPVLIKDCDRSLVQLAEYLGFSKEMSMIEFCRWHLNQLMNSKE